MKIRPFITAAVLGTVCAVSASKAAVCSAAENQKSASGLISKCMLSCSGSGGTLDIYAKTQSTMVMDNIGFNDIVLQKSSDGTEWTDALSLGSVVHSDLRYYTYSAQITVDGGYFYRVTCIHYAEGTPYRSNVTYVQTAENTSKSFFMESDQGSHGAAETTPQVTYTTSAQPVTQAPAIPLDRIPHRQITVRRNSLKKLLHSLLPNLRHHRCESREEAFQQAVLKRTRHMLRFM